MRNFCVFLFIFLTQFARAEIESGSVVVFILSDGVVTVAADSRSFETATGRKDDTYCKIAAFGNDFVFAVTGTTGDSTKWNAYGIARDAWSVQHKIVRDPTQLVNLVAERWATEIEPHFHNPEFIKALSPLLKDGNVFESALFVAVDPSGTLAINQTNFFLDITVYNKSGKIHIWHEAQPGQPVSGHPNAIGYSQIVQEFDRQTTKRAKNYMQLYWPKISSLPPASRDAALAKKLVDLTIRLHPAHDFLGFPIDELQLVGGKGVRWLHQKDSCKSQPSETPLPKK